MELCTVCGKDPHWHDIAKHDQNIKALDVMMAQRNAAWAERDAAREDANALAEALRKCRQIVHEEYCDDADGFPEETHNPECWEATGTLAAHDARKGAQ